MCNFGWRVIGDTGMGAWQTRHTLRNRRWYQKKKMATSRAQKAPSRRGHGKGRAKQITFGSGAGSRIQKVHYVVISARDRFGEGPEFCRLALSGAGDESSSSKEEEAYQAEEGSEPCLACRPFVIYDGEISQAWLRRPSSMQTCLSADDRTVD